MIGGKGEDNESRFNVLLLLYEQSRKIAGSIPRQSVEKVRNYEKNILFNG